MDSDKWIRERVYKWRMINLNKLADLIKQERQTLLSQWRLQVRELASAQHLDIPTLNDHMPNLLDELATELKSNSEATIPEVLLEDSPPAHGLQRLQEAFDIAEVVAEYNILRGCIHDLATENGINLQGKPFHVVNRVFDHAIGLALETYATQQALEVKKRREEYLAFVAHDLRTPLFAISLTGRVLEQQLPKRGYGEDAAQMLKSLRRSVQQLEGLVQKVLEENTHLEADKGIHLERRLFDLWPLVERLRDDLALVAESAGTQIINNVPDDLVVYADASLLQRILQNLVSNAVKFAPHGVVTIGAKVVVDDHSVACWVSDNGKGIPDEMLGKIFDKGETDAERDDGTGLGLAIVQTFTEAHGGAVAVESAPGVGSTFKFTLPSKAHAIAAAKS
jgi:two-component system, OmpR family, phosphate regulon sensor histidine kinase PhoR